MTHILNVKPIEEKRQGGIIENWFVDTKTYGVDSPVVRGRLYNDVVWVHGTYIRTSVVVNINEDETQLETLNTVYQLGTKRQFTEEDGNAI